MPATTLQSLDRLPPRNDTSTDTQRTSAQGVVADAVLRAISNYARRGGVRDPSFLLGQVLGVDDRVATAAARDVIWDALKIEVRNILRGENGVPSNTRHLKQLTNAMLFLSKHDPQVADPGSNAAV